MNNNKIFLATLALAVLTVTGCASQAERVKRLTDTYGGEVMYGRVNWILSESEVTDYCGRVTQQTNQQFKDFCANPSEYTPLGVAGWGKSFGFGTGLWKGVVIAPKSAGVRRWDIVKFRFYGIFPYEPEGNEFIEVARREADLDETCNWFKSNPLDPSSGGVICDGWSYKPFFARDPR